ncbi:hypothetical protein [Novosphingobium sp. SG720]|uniref:hypothetical protein n=1 Tax=Novosphingobium sp. SG720 TaxID=2586998 RepID=UPI0014454655|nr:hypothetical protein [Novosphingobium sp. SG720]NKJ43682.1 hypothetical protein [Novosphingobium sp. SG720]
MNLPKDYTPTAETISLHGLGFIQVKLMGGQRLHVWHPDLPRRSCFQRSAIHNHRFSFTSTVLKGVQINRRFDIVMHPEGSHDVISHDGPRSEKGGRLSFVAGRVNLIERETQHFMAGCSYEMPMLAYHDTPNSGVVVTLLRKTADGDIHANSLIEHGHVFDQSFDRFQLSPKQLWSYVVEALGE